jgi:hypothetical protein
MATRFDLPSINLPNLRGVAAWRPDTTADRRMRAWQAVTAPWWIWSDLPRLPLPSRNPALPPGGVAGDWVVHGLDRIATRVWIQRMLAIVVRGIWLTLLVGCLWLLTDLLGGPEFDQRIWLGFGAVIMLCSLAIALLSRPSRAQVARMLDRSFTLQERISTALGNIGKDVPVDGEHASVVYLQIADAANALTVAQEQPAFRLRPPAREFVMAIALALALAALAFARGAGGSVPPAQTNVVPAFVPAAQRFVQPEAQPTPDPQNAPSVAEVQQMVQSSIDNQQDLAALADALSDHALTRDAAEQIQQGNYSQAAEELRNVAEQADQLSQSERDDLASDLNQAASQMSDGNQSLSNATQQAADGLQQGQDEAKSGVRDLANAVEQSGQQVQSSETLDQAMQQAQQNEAANAGQQGQPASQSQPGDQGEQSAGQQNGTGDPQSASSSAASGEQSGQPGEADSNSGANAESGIGQDPQSSSGQPGEGAPSDASDSSAPGQQSGEGQGQSQQPADNGAASGESAQSSSIQNTGKEGSPNQSSGAGGESGDEQAQGGTDSNTGGKTAQDSPGKDPSEASVSDAAQTGADTSGASQDGREAVQLSRAPEGESVQVGGSSGASSLGPGAGVTVSSGATQQGEVGQTGPDSNHVPPEYRSIVESYFSDKDNGG